MSSQLKEALLKSFQKYASMTLDELFSIQDNIQNNLANSGRPDIFQECPVKITILDKLFDFNYLKEYIINSLIKYSHNQESYGDMALTTEYFLREYTKRLCTCRGRAKYFIYTDYPNITTLRGDFDKSYYTYPLALLKLYDNDKFDEAMQYTDLGITKEEFSNITFEMAKQVLEGRDIKIRDKYPLPLVIFPFHIKRYSDFVRQLVEE